MTLIELRRRPAAPRVFVEPEPGLQRRVGRALDALGALPDDMCLPGLDDIAAALIDLADELDGDPDIEPEEDVDGEEELSLAD